LTYRIPRAAACLRSRADEQAGESDTDDGDGDATDASGERDEPKRSDWRAWRG